MNIRIRQFSVGALTAAIAIVVLGACAIPFVSAQAKPTSNPDPRQAMLRFSQCMREHGVDLPDPSSSGAITIQVPAGSAPSAGAAPDDPAFQAAQTACQKYMPSGGPGSGTSQDAKANAEKALKFAQCMRQHGLPNFPDPQSNAGGGTTFQGPKGSGGSGPTGAMNINGQSFSGFDPTSPEFQKAQEACGPIMGIKAGGPGATTSGSGN